MHREIRSKDNTLANKKTIEILIKGSHGVLSTTGEDGYPFGIPLNYSYWDE